MNIFKIFSKTIPKSKLSLKLIVESEKFDNPALSKTVGQLTEQDYKMIAIICSVVEAGCNFNLAYWEKIIIRKIYKNGYFIRVKRTYLELLIIQLSLILKMLEKHGIKKEIYESMIYIFYYNIGKEHKNEPSVFKGNGFFMDLIDERVKKYPALIDDYLEQDYRKTDIAIDVFNRLIISPLEEENHIIDNYFNKEYYGIISDFDINFLKGVTALLKSLETILLGEIEY